MDILPVTTRYFNMILTCCNYQAGFISCNSKIEPFANHLSDIKKH